MGSARAGRGLLRAATVVLIGLIKFLLVEQLVLEFGILVIERQFVRVVVFKQRIVKFIRVVQLVVRKQFVGQ